MKEGADGNGSWIRLISIASVDVGRCYYYGTIVEQMPPKQNPPQHSWSKVQDPVEMQQIVVPVTAEVEQVP